MAQITRFENLKTAIQKAIKKNDNKEISGQALQSTLLSIINNTNSLAQFAGIANPNTNPKVYDGDYFYIAYEAGNYVNFKAKSGYISVDNNSLYIIYKQYDKDYWAVISIVDFINYKLSSAQDCLAKIIETEGTLQQEINSDSSSLYYRLNDLSGEIYAIVNFTSSASSVRLSTSSGESGSTITKDILYDYLAVKNESIVFTLDANINKYIRLSTTRDNQAISGVNIKLYSLNNLLTENSDLIKNIVESINSIMSSLPSKLEEFTNYTKINNKRIEAGEIRAASTGYITSYIPIDKSKKYLLTTTVNKYNSGISYYTTNDESGFISSDVVNTQSGMSVTNYQLNIPNNAKYMIASCSEVTDSFSIKVLAELAKLSDVFLTEDSDLIKNIVESINSIQPEKISAIEKKVASIQKAIEEGGGVYTSECVRERKNVTLYLGPNLLTNLTNSTYGSSWSIVGSKLIYNNSKGTDNFSFNVKTKKGLRYFAKLKISTNDNAYENLFFLRIGNAELLDVYTGSNSVSGGLLSDGGMFTIVPTGLKSFIIDEVQLYAVTDNSDYENVETKEVLNINSGNADATSIDAKWNVAIGPSSETMPNVVNGSRSIAIGIEALANWQYGLQNIAIGTYALHSLISGVRNIAIGSDCFWQTYYANDTIVIGKQALEATDKNLKLNYNVCIGNSAGHSNTRDGMYSVVIGYNACKNVGTNNVCIGANSEAGGNNSIVIGANANSNIDDSIIIGTNQNVVRIGGKLIKFNSDKSITWE